MFYVSRSLSEGGGLGWFASVDIDQGEVIAEEDAAVVAPADEDACVECLR